MKEELKEIKEKNLYRKLLPISSPQGKLVKVKNKTFLNFSSNDYLGLAKEQNPECYKEWGSGSGASRLVCGNFEIHEKLEEELAKVKKTESALLFPSGYMANVGVISTLAKEGDAIFSDELNHASLIDGCRLSKAKVFIYPHNDVETLEYLLSKHRKKFRNSFVVTDSVFSMDGDIADLPALMKLKREYDSVLIIDDAHATGVVGWSSLEVFNLQPDESTVIIGTCGKALGTLGAFVCGTKTLKEYLINRCRTFIFTTALPPSIACQTLKNLEKVPERMRKLKKNIDTFKKISSRNSQSAIFPLLVENERMALALSSYLKENGFLVPAIRPPSVKKSRLRISITSEHKKEEMERLMELIKGFFTSQ